MSLNQAPSAEHHGLSTITDCANQTIKELARAHVVDDEKGGAWSIVATGNKASDKVLPQLRGLLALRRTTRRRILEGLDRCRPHTHRIGFLVDAAILGFAAGTGFAMVENMYFLGTIPDAAIGTWIVRGLGTAIMHGGATALFAVIGLTMFERVKWHSLAAFLPGLGLATALHSGFNHLSDSPRLATLATFLIVPLLSYVVFERSERATSDSLGTGFDADTEMLALINSGHLAESPLGRYLHALKDKFNGPVVADVLCYLRLHTELALRAKGILMMRQNGFDPPVDDETRTSSPRCVISSAA